jgi:hypothetical protein
VVACFVVGRRLAALALFARCPEAFPAAALFHYPFSYGWFFPGFLNLFAYHIHIVGSISTGFLLTTSTVSNSSGFIPWRLSAFIL